MHMHGNCCVMISAYQCGKQTTRNCRYLTLDFVLEIFLFGLKKNFDAKIQNEKANIYHMDKNLFSNGALEFVLEYL